VRNKDVPGSPLIIALSFTVAISFTWLAMRAGDADTIDLGLATGLAAMAFLFVVLGIVLLVEGPVTILVDGNR
jgi:hypothetical protein